jgi:hypothetical protein
MVIHVVHRTANYLRFLAFLVSVFMPRWFLCPVFYGRFVRWVYSTLPIISARSPYSSPVAGSQLHAKVRLSTSLARSDASFLRVS